MYIYLPFDYETSGKYYPVIYLHDGQNLFFGDLSLSGSSWGINEIVNNPGQTQVIVVGIFNDAVKRFNEYSLFDGEKKSVQLISDFFGYQITEIAGEGSAYLSWIANELKAYIDDGFRTRRGRGNTAIAGSSMGGYISLSAAVRHNDTFGVSGVLSPAFWFNKAAIFDQVRNSPVKDKLNVFMTVGTNEDGIADAKEYINDAFEMNDLLKNNVANLYFETIEGGDHSEKAWHEAFKKFIVFFNSILCRD